ncbi:MAG: hypothetical protein LBC98_08085 [Prevotellaceae bacterium]|jgi:hypothetical protein|nr:hypothetical protein [Prevotellaceae bacterium]
MKKPLFLKASSVFYHKGHKGFTKSTSSVWQKDSAKDAKPLRPLRHLCELCGKKLSDYPVTLTKETCQNKGFTGAFKSTHIICPKTSFLPYFINKTSSVAAKYIISHVETGRAPSLHVILNEVFRQ